MLTASSAAAGLHTRSTLGRPRPPRPLTAAWLPVAVIHALSLGLPQLERTLLGVRSRSASLVDHRDHGPEQGAANFYLFGSELPRPHPGSGRHPARGVRAQRRRPNCKGTRRAWMPAQLAPLGSPRLSRYRLVAESAAAFS